MGEQEVTGFLTYLAANRQVTASTQNLALCYRTNKSRY
ncbi:hypothetical protein [Alishewanella sp. SMS8]